MQPPSHEPDSAPEPRAAGLKGTLGLLTGSAIAILGASYGIHENSRAREIAARQASATSAVSQMDQQIRALSAKLNDMTAAQSAAFARAEQAERARDEAQQRATETSKAPVVTVTSRRRPGASRLSAARPAPKPVPEDPRWKKFEGQLSEHETKIAGTREQLARDREELDRKREELAARLNSTRDDLGGSIARTHDDVVALQKRGEREYSEFQLAKSKEFRKVGPIGVALRKADTKHKRYDIELVVDDVKLQKKSVNLYEPVYITVTHRPQPIELVVNQIAKDQVQGYVSMPKYPVVRPQ